ncbi:hypothetical protein BD410DRAFT_835671 [Rickenella mellea]|uniref:Uncharacterized protein n=1 Tax=Rickenella mellea TaxID=50990 RepID=A0A4Y7QIE1_9AGAM|nr:hypothetical protein BD410DRAFT_835671 [Rickenella mellea]
MTSSTATCPELSPHSPALATVPLPLLPPIVLFNERSIPSGAPPRLIPNRLHSHMHTPDRHPRSRPRAKSPTPSCSPTKRRRVLNSPLSRSSGRQRHCRQSDCCITMNPAFPIFHDLPWIAAMDATPPSVNHWDIADLSQLVVEKRHLAGPGTGPIRSRKSSLRSQPFPTDITTPELSPSLSIDSPASLLSSPTLLPLLDSEDATPRTPPQRLATLPVPVHFRNLMPVPLSPLGSEDQW